MWHPISFVAESRRVDVDELESFAYANKEKYGIMSYFGYLEVNTWYVDQFVKDFRSFKERK